MRVVVVSQWFPPENASIPADIIRALVDVGHDVTVLTGFPNYPTGRIYDGWKQRPRQDTCADGYRIRRVALYPSHDSSAFKRAAGYLSFGAMSTAFGWSRLRHADVVYVYHPPLTSAIGPWLSRELGGAPYVLHVQDIWPDSVVEAGMIHGLPLKTANNLLTRACNAIYRRADGIICIAPTMASTLQARGAPDRSLHVVLNWADESAFFPTARDESMTSKLGFADHFTVMFAGNLGSLQGLDVAIRAAAQVRDLADFRLVLVGDGVARASLATLARDIGADNVIFVSPQPLSAMNSVTRCSDVQLVCLRDLSFFRGTIPSKLGAVMASGLPVICAVNGDAGALVDEAGAGWACEAGEVEALARTFRSAYASSEAELSMRGSAARNYYERHMARPTATTTIERILRSAQRRM